ncbi:MAG: hypothetical protein DCC75_02845 [Proteobacteria bacterium]|nr:MAG: hypothetical protein DCC75_02845 [Pseudomonadota bacterium]
MLVFLTALSIILATFTVILPLRRFHKAQAQDEFQRAMRYVQLRAVKRHYQVLEKLEYREIESSYDLDRSYHRIGR